MPDQSELDKKYFIDEYVYNCPFCNRKNVTYCIEHLYRFDWSDSEDCWVYFVNCGSCSKKSIHLSHEQIHGDSPIRPYFKGSDIDSGIFYSHPTSFFIIDKRIPRVIRDLFSEAEGCLKMGYLTGASVCARKIIYEIASREKTEGQYYDERIKSLKKKFPDVDPSYFDTLTAIQEATSDNVHEDSFDGWSGKHLKLILETINRILYDVYVTPKIKKDNRQRILDLKKEVLGSKREKSQKPTNSDGEK